MAPGDSSTQPETESLDAACVEAMNHQLAGRLDLAASRYREILRADPAHAAANHCLGMLHVQEHRPLIGVPYLLAAVNAHPQSADYWLGYLEALLAGGQPQAAADALALGRQHGLAGRSVEEFGLRLSLASEEGELLALIERGNLAEALAAARDLTTRFAGRGLGWKALGVLLGAERRWEEARLAMQIALRLLPGDAEVHGNLGAILTKLERYAQAETHLREALRLDPEFAAAYVPLADVCQAHGRYAEATSILRLATAAAIASAERHDDMRHTTLLFLLSHDPAIDKAALFAEHCRVGAHFEDWLRPSWPRHRNRADPERRLKIGFVSGDFFNHAVATFFEPILARLARHRDLELYGYSNNNSPDDAMTERLRQHLAVWRPVTELTDPHLAGRILEDEIDVLIDLSGHTARNRLRTFARKPAPLQASWLGYPGTTGLQAMDYYLSDRSQLPPADFSGQFVEKLVMLPAVACFQPAPAAPPVNPLPALAAGNITFGSFNRLGKISATTVSLWSALLRALPESVLLLGGIPPEMEPVKLIEEFAAHGIARERLLLRTRAGIDSYLGQHHEVDLCLDTTPYTGGTTTHHALWMGVPTLTLAGATAPARQGAGIMGLVGLDGFVAADAADFLAKGRRWAGDLTALAEIRAGLRERCRASPSHRPEAVAGGLARALRHMWRRWCAGLPPESFEIAAEHAHGR